MIHPLGLVIGGLCAARSPMQKNVHVPRGRTWLRTEFDRVSTPNWRWPSKENTVRSLFGLLALVLFAEVHAGEPPKGVTKCAQLLPEGATYTYEVDGTIERGHKQYSVDTNVSISR